MLAPPATSRLSVLSPSLALGLSCALALGLADAARADLLPDGIHPQTVPLGPAPAVPVTAPAAATPALPAPAAAIAPRTWLGVPPPTWVAGGLAAALFGVGLGFGQGAASIDHRAGINTSVSGVDLGVTRSVALAGVRDANVANGLFIGAGVAALVGLAFAALAPETLAPPAGAPAP